MAGLRFSVCWVCLLLLAGVCGAEDPVPISSAAADLSGGYSYGTGYEGASVSLKPDGTFLYEYYSCTTQRKTSGQWHVIAPGLVIASSFIQEEPSCLEGRFDPTLDSISIVAVDTEGVPLPDVRVSVVCQNGDLRRGRTGFDGKVTLESCDLLSVSADMVGFQHSESKVQDPRNNKITVKMRFYPWFGFRDRLWYIFEGQLYELERPLKRVPMTESVDAQNR